MIKSWVRYADIEEKRDGYYIEYSPVFTGQEFATLVVYIHDSTLKTQIDTVLESELRVWATKFPTPILAMAKLLVKGEWEVIEIGKEYSILAYIKGEKLIRYKDNKHEPNKPKFDLSKEQLSKIYAGLSYHTLEDVIQKQDKQAKGRKLLLLMLTFWFCVIPALIAYLGWSSQFFSLLALGYSWFKAYQKAMELWGKKKKSPRELAKEKDNQEKEHHHYHCKRNPEAFMRLKAENFKGDEIEKNQNKVDSMCN
ncbi:hypothetical protein [Photobacterium kagoshimensis]|uniref:hypothetical protein n=1 Tax=Photobacterium kagoshimensis TaxID=2910242 RepID=UPI003D0E43C7